MPALEFAISKVFFDVATSMAVDVVTRRSTNPAMRALGRAYKVYVIVNPAACVRCPGIDDVEEPDRRLE